MTPSCRYAAAHYSWVLAHRRGARPVRPSSYGLEPEGLGAGGPDGGLPRELGADGLVSGQ